MPQVEGNRASARARPAKETADLEAEIAKAEAKFARCRSGRLDDRPRAAQTGRPARRVISRENAGGPGIFARALKTMLFTSACAAPAAYSSPFDTGLESYRVASDAELAEMRGGFEVNLGNLQLQLSFAIERVTYINNELITRTQIVLPSLDALVDPRKITANLPDAAAITQAVQDRVQAQLAAASVPGSAPSGTATNAGNPAPIATDAPFASQAESLTSSGNPVPVAQNGSAPVNAAIATPTSAGNPAAVGTNGSSATVTAQAVSVGNVNHITVIQNGANNTFIPIQGLNVATAAMMTVIQNTLDNQVIRNETIINTTLNSQSLIRAMALTSSINQMLANSVR